MKNLNKLFTAFALMILVGSANIFAQETANVAVTAEVQAVLSLTPTAVALGTIQTGSASVIDANSNDDATEDNLGNTSSPGSLQITGTTGVNVVVSWANATLTNGTQTLAFTPSVWLGNSELTTPAGSTVALTGGDITIDVGGSLAAPAATGSYTTVGATPIVFSVSYE